MSVIPAFTIKHPTDTTVKSSGWGLIEVKATKSYRVELEDFEPIFYHDDKMKEFEELLRYRDEHLKIERHIKVLLYGKDKDNTIIAIVLMKILTTDHEGYTIVAYNLEKELKTLRTFKMHTEKQQDP